MRIFVVSSYGYWGKFTPDDLGGDNIQVGGGETAMVNISRELAALGHDVICFYDTKPGRYSGVDYLPTEMFVPTICNLKCDVFVSWDNPYVFRFTDRADLRVLAFQLNSAGIGVLDWNIDLYFHPSQWHADRFHKLYPEMSRDKSVPRITNGINFERYSGQANKVYRNPYRVIYSSSPDRGLHHLLRVWPRIVEAVPQAELHVFYDMSKWLEIDKQMTDAGMTNITHERAEQLRGYVGDGLTNVYFRGGVGQGLLAREQLASSVLAYPCDPVAPTEGFSMTVLEGIASGCHVVTTNADAFPELWSNTPGLTMLPLPIDDDLWVEAIVGKLGVTKEYDLMFRPDLSWAHLARRWEIEFRRCLSQLQSGSSSA